MFNLLNTSELITWYYNKFDFVTKYFSEKYKKKVEKNLYQARMDFNAEHYIAFSFGIALTAALLSIISFIYMPQFSIPIFLIVFSMSYLLVIKEPERKKQKIAKEIEKEMTTALRSIGVELNINVPFEKCIENVANSDYKLLSVEFKKIMKGTELGASIPESLEKFAQRTDSSFVKKSVSQLVNVYQKGAKERAGEILKKTADEQNAVMKAKYKEYNGKLMLYSLVFIACSAIVPAMFQAYVIIGSSFLNLIITPLQALLIPVFVFPTVNFAIFMMIKSKRP